MLLFPRHYHRLHFHAGRDQIWLALRISPVLYKGASLVPDTHRNLAQTNSAFL
jgi:hypothetical protein